ncbi:hypothetical protein [Microbacterium sp. CPCC 204701]|uniref:hypothetical protein n=1 Tax=Microbacterium sp. CPCC 204701 TaxID=2493084 RepID=UPI000FD8C019|nr:hypothetical protein [Microbacterium sp. CPCC 204701]
MADLKDPGAGDPWTLRAAGWERQFKAAAVTAMSTSVVSAASAASGASWTGQAQVAFQASVDVVVPDLTSLAESLAATGAALVVYADGVARIKDKQEALERRRARLQDEYDELEAAWRRASAAADGHYVTNEEQAHRADELSDELHVVGGYLDAVREDWGALVREREALDDAFIAALTTRAVRGALYDFVQDRDCLTAAEMLLALSTLSAADMKALAAAHPELLEQVLRESTPEQVAAWWGELPGGQQQSLIANLPGLVGALGGVPALARVAANKLVAAERLKTLRSSLRALRERGVGDYDTNQPYAAESAVANYLEKVQALEAEVGFLERVASGDAQLYLYDPAGSRIIEMFGNPDTANVVMSFLPGTNTTMESFYDSKGITAFTRMQVETPLGGTNVAGLVVMLGPFPNIEDLWSEGPQHNWYADVLGRRYAGFSRELGVITGDKPVVSVEHSFGSAVGGVAETTGAHFDARYMLAGIGMRAGWERQDGTAYYAAQGPGDVNRYLDGMELNGLGYAVTPSEANGVDERPSGYGVPDVWPHALFGPGPVLVEMGSEALVQHNDILSDDPKVNEVVQADVRLVLRDVAIKEDTR